MRPRSPNVDLGATLGERETDVEAQLIDSPFQHICRDGTLEGAPVGDERRFRMQFYNVSLAQWLREMRARCNGTVNNMCVAFV